MYTPSSFKEENPDILFDLIEVHNFGIIFSQHEDQPEATHLPFLVHREKGKHGTLIAHFAKANKHWKKLDESKDVLVVFQGPHSYISPAWYVNRAEVPTWNYATVHVFGKPKIIEDVAELNKMVKELTHFHENQENTGWRLDEVPEKDYNTDLKAIVGLEIEISKIEGKFKFNQNKSDKDQESVIAKMEDSGRKDISEIMKRNLDSSK
ncbi:MAG: FMN-binding negative transcriptional regulator [Balneola sp.]|jgi:transcriptional regulator